MEPLVLKTDAGQLRLWPWADNQVRVTLTRAEGFREGSGPLVTQPPRPVAARLTRGSNETVLHLPGLRVHVESSGRLTYRAPDGLLLTEEPPQGGRELHPFEVVRYDYEPVDGPSFEFGADGFKARSTQGRPRVDRTAWHAKHRFLFHDEALYGLGSHEEGVLNLRGTVQYLYQQNRKIAVPYLVSTRGWSLFWNSGSTMTFRDDASGSSMALDCVEELDFWFTASPSMDELAALQRRLTGDTPLLPQWSFGYVQSKERYKTQDEMVAVAREFQRRELPLSCLVLDWQSWPEGLWGQKSLDPERFPDPGALADQLHELGVKWMVSIWPILRAGGRDHAEFAQHGWLLGNGGNYDAFNPAARDLYWRQAHDGLFRHGVDAWWCDCSEPFEADWNGAESRDPEDRRTLNVGEFHKYLDPAVANLYSLAHSEGLYTHQRAVTDAKRVVNLTRSSYPGQQRWSTIAWSGDFSATWEEFAKQIPALQNYCATGLPWWTFDIGGFFVNRRPDLWFWAGGYPQGVADPDYRELYLRMAQFGAYLPMFRSHGTDTPREPWQFGDVGDPVYEALTAAMRFRHRLVPWIYSQAAAVASGQGNLVTPVAFACPDDAATHDLKDEYLFGGRLLVCPVIRPVAESGGRRTVYLPEGLWYDLTTGRAIDGGRQMIVEAGLDRIPVFVRAGTVVVLQDPWELRVYPGADAEWDWYDDAGDGYAYERGETRRTRVRWDESARTLAVEAPRGTYPGAQARDWSSFRVTGPDGRDLGASLRVET